VRRALLLALVPVVVLLAACDTGDGRDLAAPGEGNATARAATPSTVPPPTDPAFVLTSPAFDDGAPIPPDYTLRDGSDLSPPLAWSGTPVEAQQLALVVTDLDADGFVHWVLTGLDPSLTALDAGQAPDGSVAAVNDFGNAGWGGPAPIGGDEHRYRFRLHALDAPLTIEADQPADTVMSQIDAATIATTDLVGTYR
jgi:Raf kinase inhibitor-like YbhB/YbcL family protein